MHAAAKSQLSKIQDDDDVIANARLLQIKPAKNYNLLGCSRKKKDLRLKRVTDEFLSNLNAKKMAGLSKKKPNLKSNILAFLESRSLGLVRTEDEKFALFKAKVDEFTCIFCGVVPRKRHTKWVYKSVEKAYDSDYLITENDIACRDCRKGEGRRAITYSPMRIFKRDKSLENLFSTLPTSCKARKYGCQFVEYVEKIGEHEDECEFREVICPISNCRCNISLKDLLEDHLKLSNLELLTSDDERNWFYEHFKDLKTPSPTVEIDGSKFKFKFKKGVGNTCCQRVEHFHFDGKTFLCHVDYNLDGQEDSSSFSLWIQLIGSRSQAKNYISWIQVGNPDVKAYSYTGPIKCIDDDRIDTFFEYFGLCIRIFEKGPQIEETLFNKISANEISADVEVEMKKIGPKR